ncbi:MAG: type IV secretory system conjugative DNA transfer family protein, partial [Acidimicrobiales bacterium]
MSGVVEPCVAVAALVALVVLEHPGRSTRVDTTLSSAKGHLSQRWGLGPLRRSGPGRITLGACPSFAGCRRMLRAEAAQSLAVVGPTQSGKTTSLAIPAILGWEGPVVAASVKSDLVWATREWRGSLGTSWFFDPAGTTGVRASAWSPLPAAATWSGARRVASDLTEVARSPATTPDGEFWYAAAAKLLAPLLFAAAVSGATVRDLIRWVDTQEVAEVARVLDRAGVDEAIWAATASWQRDERQRSSVYTTVETVLEPLAGCLDACGPAVDPERLVAGNHTLYMCAPAHDQRRL